MALEKTLETKTKVKSWNFDTFNTKGQRIGLKNSNGDYKPIITVESVKCSEGINSIQRSALSYIRKDTGKNCRSGFKS